MTDMAERILQDPKPHRTAKSAAAFRTISEVALELDVPQHVLRFWETRFPQIRPLKRGGGRRYYRPEDLLFLRRIRDLLYGDGYTIKGVQKVLRENNVKALTSDGDEPAIDGGKVDKPALLQRADLEELLAELESLRGMLDGTGR
jgi:DNA-binding transcriptional MerR regulator